MLRLKTYGWNSVEAINEDRDRREVHYSIMFTILDEEVEKEEIVIVLKKNSMRSIGNNVSLYMVSDVSDRIELFDEKSRTLVKAKSYVELIVFNYFHSIRNKNNVLSI